MDKLGAIRFEQSSGHKFVSGVGVVVEKSKERIRKLSVIGSSSFEMGCDVSDREHEELPSKRSKLPRKFLSDCNGVHPGSIPRLLHSGCKSHPGIECVSYFVLWKRELLSLCQWWGNAVACTLVQL